MDLPTSFFFPAIGAIFLIVGFIPVVSGSCPWLPFSPEERPNRILARGTLCAASVLELSWPVLALRSIPVTASGPRISDEATRVGQVVCDEDNGLECPVSDQPQSQVRKPWWGTQLSRHQP